MPLTQVGMRLVRRGGRLFIFVSGLAIIACIAAYSAIGPAVPLIRLRKVDYKNTLPSEERHVNESLDAILSQKYIARLEEIRLQLVNMEIHINKKPRMVEVFLTNKADYFGEIKRRHPEVRTIFFNASVSVVAPYLVKDYYGSVVSNCTLGGPFVSKTEKCLSRFEDMVERRPMSTALQQEMATRYSETGTFIRVMTSAMVSPDGDVVKDNFKIIPIRCQGLRSKPHKQFNPKHTWYSRHREVFTITQFWGEGFFHFMVEDLPRIAVYLPFLHRHPEVKVHVAVTNRFTVAYLQELGIEKSRLVSGHVAAGVLYMPGGTRCGQARLFSTQLLSLRLRAGLAEPKPPRNTVILIKRTTKRWFKHHTDILAMIRRHAGPAGLQTVVYGDQPVPGIEASRHLFARAHMIVAPHGAGLVNMIFSPPGTFVVEGMFYLDGKPNWCFRTLAHVLGHRYYGQLGKQCMDVTANDLEPVVKYAVGRFKRT